MALTWIVADSLVIIPNSEDAILSSWYKVLSLSSNVQSVELLFWTLDRSDNLTIKFFPIRYFPVRSNRKDLILFRVEKGLLKGRSFEHTKEPWVLFNVPKNARAITAGWNCLGVVFADLNGPDPASVLFEWNFHHLSLLGHLPNSNLSFSSSWDNALAIRSDCDGCAPVVVGIIDDIEEFSGLRQECSYFSIWPTWKNALSVMGKGYWVTVKTRNLDS